MNKSVHSPDQVRFQELLRQLRKEAGFTQQELAKRLDTPVSRISNYERGDRRMDLVQLKEYVAAMGLRLHDFVDRFEGVEEKASG